MYAVVRSSAGIVAGIIDATFKIRDCTHLQMLLLILFYT